MHSPDNIRTRRSDRRSSTLLQRGVSLVELMVGVTIGLMVVLAAVGTIVLTRQSSSTISDATQLAAQGASALRLIGAQIRQAGAIETVPAEAASPVVEHKFLFSSAYDGLDIDNNGTRLDGLPTLATQPTPISVFGTEGGTNPDTLNISYQDLGANTTRDCLGNAAPAAAANIRIENFFSMSGTDLRCAGGSAPAAPQPIAGDVEDFQVMYVVETLAGATPVHRLRDASQVTAANQWGNVVAVEVCLQMRGLRADYPASGNFVDCRGTSTARGGRLHQVFRNTFYLRNLGR